MADCACNGKSLPRLVRPWVMAILAGGEAHGYEIAQQLTALRTFAEHEPDLAGIYRALKEMEGQGLLASRWDLGDSGPAKRVYAITAAGQACLGRWKESLEDYRDALDALLARVNSVSQEAAA